MVCGKRLGIVVNTQRGYQSNRQRRCTYAQESASQQCPRYSRIVVHALETVVNPTEDSTPLRTTAILQSLKHWRDTHAEFLQNSMGNVSAHLVAAARQQQRVSSVLSSELHSTMENHEYKIKLMMGR